MSDNHGNTPAAWTAVTVAMLGFVVGAVGLMLDPINWVILWIGINPNRELHRSAQRGSG